MGKKIQNLINKLDLILKSLTNHIILPGFKGYSLYYVGSFFFKGILKGSVSMRASSVAFNLFISLFPALIFLFSLIPFIPVENFQYELFSVLAEVLPDNAYSLMYETISDTIMNQRSSILSIGFLLMLFFSSNGVMAMIEAFNTTYHHFETRSDLSIRLISLLLVLILSLLLMLAISLIIIGNNVFVGFISNHPVMNESGFVFFLVGLLKWILIVGLYFLAISFLYYLAPAKRSRFRFITPGAIFATFLQIITVIGFSYYVNNFAQYNKLYGSIGTVIVVMMLFYISSLALILGFELNVSIFSRENKISKK
ncbi:MAG: YihY/virulence factor BrkB family protein [Bacteroidales bacterium]|nr:YihY/virulence factor BrkB family protein [Bacteroidales bacterium]MDD3858872.1 YihY/virulence factor BrkB family protein [Bacteroidales bacterium]